MKYLQNGGLLLTKKFPSTFYAIYEMIVDSNTISTMRNRSLIQIQQFIFIYLNMQNVTHKCNHKYNAIRDSK